MVTKKQGIQIGIVAVFVFLLVQTNQATADDRSSLRINNDAIYQEESVGEQSEYDKIRSNLFTDQQNEKNERLKQQEVRRSQSTGQLFTDNKSKSNEGAELVEPSLLFSDNFTLEEAYLPKSVSVDTDTNSFVSWLALGLASVLFLCAGWYLGNNQWLRNRLAKGRKNE